MPTNSDSDSGILNVTIGFLGLLLFLLLLGLLARFVYPRIQNNRTETNRDLISNVIQIAVLNGCGVSGIADKFTFKLRKHGFDVVETGNFKNFNMEHTIVISRLPNPVNAKKLREPSV